MQEYKDEKLLKMTTEDLKPKLSGEEFVEKLKEAGFTAKTIAALEDEDVATDASLRILSHKDIETLADKKSITIGQKRLLVEFAARLQPKRRVRSGSNSRSNSRSTRPHRVSPRSLGFSSSSSSRRHERTTSRSPLSNRRRHDGDRMNPKESTCIGVFNLQTSTTEQKLFDVFSQFGYVRDVQIVYDRMKGTSRGFAFVYFDDLDSAVIAKDSCSGMNVDGRAVRTQFSITTRPHSPTPGAYLGKQTRGFGRHNRGRHLSRFDPSESNHRSSYSSHSSHSSQSSYTNVRNYS